MPVSVMEPKPGAPEVHGAVLQLSTIRQQSLAIVVVVGVHLGAFVIVVGGGGGLDMVVGDSEGDDLLLDPLAGGQGHAFQQS